MAIWAITNDSEGLLIGVLGYFLCSDFQVCQATGFGETPKDLHRLAGLHMWLVYLALVRVNDACVN
jgi:hypothetical protein